MRYVQQSLNKKPKKEKPARELPKAGKYSVKDLETTKKKGVWEKYDD